MTTLRQFSEKERNYHKYQARQNYLRQQRTMPLALDTSTKDVYAPCPQGRDLLVV
ncbi:hypothetical protein CCP3SC15_4360001 [Gammaproteobacteria bacterium]